PMSSTAPAPAATAADSVGRWPAVLCWLAVALEGFDLVVLGAVIPELLATQALGLHPRRPPLWPRSASSESVSGRCCPGRWSTGSDVGGRSSVASPVSASSPSSSPSHRTSP